MMRRYLTASMVPAVFATACATDTRPDYVNEKEMRPEQLAAIQEEYADFLGQEGIGEFIGDVTITPVTGFLDFRAPGTEARDMVETLTPVDNYLVTNSGAFLDHDGPFRLEDGNPFWWPMDFSGLERHPVEEWPQVAFFDVTAEIEGLPRTYRALVFRRASGYTHIVDPILNVQPLMRVTATSQLDRIALNQNGANAAPDDCPDISASNGWIHNRVQVDCVIDWAPDHTLAWEVDWDLKATVDCSRVNVSNGFMCAAQNPQATTTIKQQRFYYDGSLVSGFGNGYTCDYWGPTKIYYKAEFASDDAEDTYRNETTNPPVQYGAHMAWAGGLRVLGQNGPWGAEVQEEKVAWLPLLTGTAAGTTILYHTITFLHWMLSNPDAPPKEIESQALKVEGNYACPCSGVCPTPTPTPTPTATPTPTSTPSTPTPTPTPTPTSTPSTPTPTPTPTPSSTPSTPTPTPTSTPGYPSPTPSYTPSY